MERNRPAVCSATTASPPDLPSTPTRPRPAPAAARPQRIPSGAVSTASQPAASVTGRYVDLRQIRDVGAITNQHPCSSCFVSKRSRVQIPPPNPDLPMSLPHALCRHAGLPSSRTVPMGLSRCSAGSPPKTARPCSAATSRKPSVPQLGGGFVPQVAEALERLPVEPLASSTRKVRGRSATAVCKRQSKSLGWRGGSPAMSSAVNRSWHTARSVGRARKVIVRTSRAVRVRAGGR